MIRLILTLLALSALSATAGLLVLNGRLVVLDGKAVNIEAAAPDLIPRDGLVAWYRGAGNALDSALSNNGTWALGTERYTTGRIGQAFDFDGASFIDCGTNSSINLTNDFCVAMWAKTSDTNTTIKGLIAKVANNDAGWQVSRTEGSLRFPIYLGPGSAKSNADLPSNTWTHIVCKHTKASNRNEIYVDGVLQTVTSTRSITPQPTLRLVIGALYSIGGTFRFTGSIDETLIYTRALTPAEIAILADPASYPPE